MLPFLCGQSHGWPKPTLTQSVLVRVVHPLADPEDGNTSGVLSLLCKQKRQENKQEAESTGA